MRTVMRAGPGTTGLKIRKKAKREKLKFARDMRLRPTPAEAALWERLRMGRLGFKFRRQAIVRGYIVDFWCPQVRLVVEADGAGHFTAKGRAWDWQRDHALAALGILTMRFRNERILDDQQAVCSEIFDVAVRRLRERETQV